MVELLLPPHEIEGVFLADVSVFGEKFDMLDLQVEIEVFELIEPKSAHFKIFGQFSDLFPFIPQVVDQGLDELFLLIVCLFLLLNLGLEAIDD